MMAVIKAKDILHLPAPVQRYLNLTGIIGLTAISQVTLRQRGSLCMKKGGAWHSFCAEQHFSVDPLSFVWRAQVHLLPLINVLVIDEFSQGRGAACAKLFSRITALRAIGPEVTSGELLRYVAETFWFPTVWLSAPFHWQEIDTRSTKVTLNTAAPPSQPYSILRKRRA